MVYSVKYLLTSMKQTCFKKSSLLTLALVGFLAAGSTASAQFVNGGFEDGNFNGWTRGSGRWFGGSLNPSTYFSPGVNYSAAYDQSAIVTPGNDPIVGSLLNRVYSGNYSLRVNNQINDYSVSAVRQTVTNYTDDSIFFSWAAVLEDSHGSTDSDNFTLKLTNDTKGLTLYSVSYNSFDNGSIFKQFGNWYYTSWQVQNLDVSAYKGDTFTLELLSADCPYGGHAGYTYLDGFGSVLPPIPSSTAVPEPSTYGMIGAGVLLIGAMLRRRFAKR